MTLKNWAKAGPLVCILLALGSRGHADSDQRGIWFWQSGGIHGSLYVINDPTLRTQAISWFQYEGIDRVYGSYGNFVGGTNEANVIAWNAELKAAGIESHLLLGGSGAILDDPITPTGTLSNTLVKITERFVDFNASVAVDERFDAIHLDLEPQQLSEWDLYPDATNLPLRLENRRVLYYQLADTFEAIRNHLVGLGEGGTEVNADLNDWVDRITPSTRFMWTSAVQRADYYTDLATSLDGISLMSYELPTYSMISNRVVWETENISGMNVRIGLNADITNTWPNVNFFWDMVEQVEDAFGFDKGLDLHSYSNIRSQYILATVSGVSTSVVAPSVGTFGVDITIGGGIEIIYGTAVFVGEKASDLSNGGNWEGTGVGRVGSRNPVGLATEGSRGYFRIAQYLEDQGYKDRPGPSPLNPLEVGMINQGNRQITYHVISPRSGTTYEESLPLVLLSPDADRPASDFSNLAERLAEWGYICATVGHPPGPETDLRARGNDLIAIMHALVNDVIAVQQVKGRINPERIAVIGHGLGSTTALKLCGLTFEERIGEQLTSMYDPDFDMAIALSPRILGLDRLTSNSWSAVRAPVLSITGSNDVTLDVRNAEDRQQAYQALPRKAAYQLWLDGAAHNDFTDDGIKINGDRYSRFYFQAILAMLDAQLYDDEAAVLWLRAQTLNRLSQGAHVLDWK